MSNDQFLGNEQGDILMVSMTFSLRDGNWIQLDDMLPSGTNPLAAYK
ncbi:hypothetical protein ACE3MZ_00745 [Paenibacillus sp. WLX1005]